MASDRQFSWRRSVAWAVSLGVHLALMVAMTLPRELVPEPMDDGTSVQAWVLVDVWDPARAEPQVLSGGPADEPDPLTVASASPARARAEPSVDLAEDDPGLRRAHPPAVAASAADGASAPVGRTIAYLDDDARALLPQESLYSATPPPRAGSYFTPGDGREDDVFYRPRALDPNPSRFAYAWRPRGNLVDDWLGGLVEKASGKVSIPLNEKFSLVCGTVAGLAGGCTIVRNGGTGVIVQRPPPAPWDRSNRVQCRELREALDRAEEAAEVAYCLDRLSALCGGDDPTAQARVESAAGMPQD